MTVFMGGFALGVRYWLDRRFLDLVPRFLRTRWPLRRYYWQTEELEAVRERAEALGKRLRE